MPLIQKASRLGHLHRLPTGNILQEYNRVGYTPLGTYHEPLQVASFMRFRIAGSFVIGYAAK